MLYLPPEPDKTPPHTYDTVGSSLTSDPHLIQLQKKADGIVAVHRLKRSNKPGNRGGGENTC